MIELVRDDRGSLGLFGWRSSHVPGSVSRAPGWDPLPRDMPPLLDDLPREMEMVEWILTRWSDDFDPDGEFLFDGEVDPREEAWR